MIPAKSTGISNLKEAARSCKKDSAARAAEAARGAEDGQRSAIQPSALICTEQLTSSSIGLELKRAGSPRSCHAGPGCALEAGIIAFRKGSRAGVSNAMHVPRRACCAI